MNEKELLNRTLVQVGKETNAIMFRNNVGHGWCGKVIRKSQTGNSFTVTLQNARPVKFGLFSGSSDLIGWTSVEIKPEMVGQEIAVFTALEGKTKKVKVRENQQNFINQVLKAGGIAGVFRSESGAIEIIAKFPSTTNE